MSLNSIRTFSSPYQDTSHLTRMELFQMEVSNHVTCMILKLSSVDHIGWAECLLDTTAPVDLVKWAAAFQQFVGLNVEQALQHLHGNHASWNPYKARLAEAALLDIDRFYDRHSFSEQETPCPYSESQLLDLSQAYYSFILD